MKSLPLLILLGALGASAQALAQVPVIAAKDQAALLKDKSPQLAANKKLVFDFLRIVLNAGHIGQADRFLASNVIEHNPVIPSGRTALMKILGRRPKTDIQPNLPGLVAILADGDLVTVVSRMELNDPSKQGAKYTTCHFDMFRVKNGKIVEHWDDQMKGDGLPAKPAPPG